ncbi:MAG: 5'-3' exonuclease H3TH domain-containing protein [Nitriliruptoraceae bacterium]
MHRLLAIDGNSLGHRGFHSSRNDDNAGPHVVTGTVVSMIASVWHHGPYDGVLIAFDHPVNRRKHDTPAYKAQRASSDPAITAAIRQFREDAAAAGMYVIDHPGAEADDLLAAAVDACGERAIACDVLSSDRDLIALVDDTVRLLRPAATFAQLHVEDRDAVVRRWGIQPHQYTDMAALRGDPSDGLEGAVGIGAKTAARLIRDYGSVTALYAAINDLPPRIEASLRSARHIVERNLLLMAPIPHLEVDLDECTYDIDRIESTFANLGERSAARRLRRAVLDPRPPQPRPPPPDDMAEDHERDVSHKPVREPEPGLPSAGALAPEHDDRANADTDGQPASAQGQGAESQDSLF